MYSLPCPRGRRYARFLSSSLVVVSLAALGGCASAAERRAQRTLEAIEYPARAAWQEPRGETPEVAAIADFTALLAEAARRSPTLRAAWYDARAAARDVTGAGRWPEPMVGMMAMVGAHEAFVGEVNARQTVPWPTKPGLAAEVAAARVDVSRRALDRELRALVRDLRVAWVMLARSVEVRGLIDAQAALVARLRGLVEARVATGAAPYADLVRLGLREELLAERALSVADEAAGVAAQLRAVAGLPPDTPLPAPTLPTTLPERPSAEAIAAGLDASPEVLLMEAARGVAEAGVTRADASGLPDFTVGVGWSQMMGVMGGEPRPDMVSLMLEVKVPIWRDVYASEADAARARVEAATSRRDAARQAAEGQIFAWVRAFDRARRRAELFTGRLRQSVDSALTATLDAYGAGRANVTDVLALEDQLLGQALEALDARAEAARLAALLDYHLAPAPAPPGAASEDTAPPAASARADESTDPESPAPDVNVGSPPHPEASPPRQRDDGTSPSEVTP